MLDAIAGWPVDRAAAGVIQAGRMVADYGAQDEPFALASLTKLLTAAALHVAVEEESVSLDDPVGIGDADPHVGPEERRVRLSNLLDHSSGLAPDERRFLASPGERRIYSNAGYEVAADHVEARTGITFAAYFREATVEALGLTATALVGSPAHGATSSVADLGRFVLALRDGLLISPASVQAMTTPSRPPLVGVLPGYGRQQPNSWALGAEVRGTKSPHWTAPSNSPATWGHFGGAGTFIWTDPALDVTVICLTDKAWGEWAISRWPELSARVVAELR